MTRRVLLTFAFATLFVAAVRLKAQNPPRPASVPAFEMIGGQGIVSFVVVAPDVAAIRLSLWKIADYLQQKRGERAAIQVMFWTSKNDAATGLPMSDRQLARQVAQANINPRTGLRELTALNGRRFNQEKRP
jgi:hypothetical protein